MESNSQQKARLLINGKEVNFRSSLDAIDEKIGMVHQNFMLVPSFTVADNVVLGNEPIKKNKLIDKKEVIEVTEQLSEQYGLKVYPEAIVDSINVGMRQRVEIIKMLYREAEILIMDEPTAVLTPQETTGSYSMRSINWLIREKQLFLSPTNCVK